MWKYIIFLTDSLSRSSCPPSTQFRDYRSEPPHLTNYQFSFDGPYSFHHGWGSGLRVPSIIRSPSQAIACHGFLRHSSPVVLCVCSLVRPEFYLFSKEHTRVLINLTKLVCKVQLMSTHKSTYNQLAWPRKVWNSRNMEMFLSNEKKKAVSAFPSTLSSFSPFLNKSVFTVHKETKTSHQIFLPT